MKGVRVRYGVLTMSAPIRASACVIQCRPRASQKRERSRKPEKVKKNEGPLSG